MPFRWQIRPRGPQRPEPAATRDIIQSGQLYPLRLMGHGTPRASGCRPSPAVAAISHIIIRNPEGFHSQTRLAREDERGWLRAIQRGTAVPLVHSNQRGPQTPRLGGLGQEWIAEAVTCFYPICTLSTPTPMDAG